MFNNNTSLKKAYAEHLRNEGQGVSIDVSIDRQVGTIDILTNQEIIFCALELDGKSAIALKSQLNFYSRFTRSREKVAVVQKIIEPSAADQLSSAGIRLVTFTQPGTLPARSAARPAATAQARPIATFPKPVLRKVYRYPALNSVQGGDGLYLAAITFTIVFMLGFVGLMNR